MAYLGTPTCSSNQKQKVPVPYSTMMRKVNGKMKLMADEFAAESATNIEFEESSRRSFEFLTGQVRALKGAFTTLSDTLLEELEHLSNSIRSDLWQLEQRQGPLELRQDAIEQLQGAIEQRMEQQVASVEQRQAQQVASVAQQVASVEQRQAQQVASVEQRQALLERSIEQHLQQHFHAQKEAQREVEKAFKASLDDLRQADEQGRQQLSEAASRHEHRVEQLALDMDTVLGVIPEIEETMRGSDGLLQEKVASVVMDVSKINEVVVKERAKAATSLERIEAKIKTVSADMHEELEQRHLKLQRNLTKQLETMSKALLQEGRPSREAPLLGSSAPRVDVFGMPSGLSSNTGQIPRPEDVSLAQQVGYHRQVDFDLSALDSPRLNVPSASTLLHGTQPASLM